LIVLGLVMVQVRRYPERSGAYLLGASILPLIVLTSIVSQMPACPGSGVLSGAPRCYAPVTQPAIGGYAIAGLVGALLLGFGLRRIFSAPPP
jgi:hypothetical protein